CPDRHGSHSFFEVLDREWEQQAAKRDNTPQATKESSLKPWEAGEVAADRLELGRCTKLESYPGKSERSHCQTQNEHENRDWLQRFNSLCPCILRGASKQCPVAPQVDAGEQAERTKSSGWLPK